MNGPEILLEGVTKRFARADGPNRTDSSGAVPEVPAALEGISLSVARGELVVLVGPSGCGKSTTLRVVAGLESPDSGTVLLAGRSMRGVPPQDRDVAMVFQGYALYPHMTARQILEFPLKMRGKSSKERARAVGEAAEILKIGRLLDRRPGELSGGERQRVAMGRAIVRKPRVFLFDEPLSNLDAALRGDIRLELGDLVRQLGATALYVTHDQVEAMTLGDRIAVLRGGRILQVAPPRVVYENPATSFVGGFLGSPRMNLLPGRADGDFVVAGGFRFPRPVKSLPERVAVGFRPEHVVIADEGAKGRVVAVEPLGAETNAVVRVAEQEVRIRLAGFDAPLRGAEVRLAVDAGKAFFFREDGDGERLA